MKKLQRDLKGNRQIQRAVLKAQKLRGKVARLTQAFLERFQQRCDWWKRTFRIPHVSQRWLFTQASSLWSAFMSLLGLSIRTPKSKVRVGSASRSRDTRYVRADAAQLVYESLESRQLMAGLPEVIELAFDSSSISQITPVGSDVYFVASNQDKGQELWKVDSGSATGATLVKDIRPGSSGSNPFSLTNVNGTLYFSANDGVNGDELWVLRPTAAVTLSVTPTSVSVNEGSSNTFTVRLSAQPATNVTVSIGRTSGDADLTVSGGASLTFTPANFNTAQTVTLSAAEDLDVANGSAIFDVTSSGLTTVSVTASEVDNDVQSMIVTPISVSVNE